MKALLVSLSGRIRNWRCVQRRVIMYVRPGRTSRAIDIMIFRRVPPGVATKSTSERFSVGIRLPSDAKLAQSPPVRVVHGSPTGPVQPPIPSFPPPLTRPQGL
jgi:hypothetical protein